VHVFSGIRCKRGLYKNKPDNTVINADINGSVNILRKYLKSKSKTINVNDVRAFVNMPCPRINPWAKAHKSLVCG